jgi:hypothetical protein
MKKILFTIIFSLILSTAIFSQSNNSKKPVREITICNIELTAEGKTANFHFNYVYFLKTNSIGETKIINKLHSDNPRFVEDEAFLTCIGNWKLKPSRDYSLVISFGTNSAENLILLSNDEEKLKVNL